VNVNRLWRHPVAMAAGAAVLAAASALALWIVALCPASLGDGLGFSTTVVDREGRLLRPYATAEGRWRLPARADGVDPRFLALLIASEDRRFRHHFGIDPLALARAAEQMIVSRRIVSGASTLTMQVARLLEPRAERSFAAKLRQAVRAVEIERRLTKDEILTLYLNLAPYGGNLEGIRAASLAYFGKEPRRLTLGESALLVALPQAPEARRPDRFAVAARRARDRVLDRAAAAGVFETADIVRAKAEPLPAMRRPMPMLAPHAAEEAVAQADHTKIPSGVVLLTIDARWQASLEQLAQERARALGPGISVAILAVDHGSGEVLARVGSADYFDAERAGQVDMTAAVRSPGSTLKPFIYGLGFEDGVIHPETLIDDRPVRYGNYAPENFDLTFQGTVSVRRALQMSLNVPAVEVLNRVGAGRFMARLRQAGGALSLPDGAAPGLAMGLGGVGVKLSDLVMLYSGFARLGTTTQFVERAPVERALVERAPGTAGVPPALSFGRRSGRDARGPGNPANETRRLMEPAAAWYVADILRGVPPPENAPGGRIAFKTGTSYGFRDAWSVGFDGKRTVGVWVGRPDGAPVPGLTGRTAAAPILFDAFARSGQAPVPLPAAPHGAVFAGNANLTPPLQRFRPAGALLDVGGGDGSAEPPPRILFPPNGARLELTADEDGDADPVALKITGGASPLTVLINGVPLEDAGPSRTFFFKPDGPGFARLTVMDARGQVDSVTVRLQ
jgi:penicillin-binding protein 1C